MYAKLKDVSIYFDVEGSSRRAEAETMVDYPTCIVLHGGPGMDHTYFKPWLTPLTEYAQLVYLDHRGNGRSSRGPISTYNMAQFADDVEEVRRYLGLDQVFVLGNSFGGFIALQHALRHTDSVAGLILSNTAPSSAFAEEMLQIAETRASDEQKAIMPLLFEGKHYNDEHLMEWWRVMASYYYADPDEIVMRDFLAHLSVSVGVANYMIANELGGYDVREELARLISVPTLVIGGRHDGVTPISQSELMHESIPGSELEIFENSGHFPFAEEQDLFNRRVGSFIAKLGR